MVDAILPQFEGTINVNGRDRRVIEAMRIPAVVCFLFAACPAVAQEESDLEVGSTVALEPITVSAERNFSFREAEVIGDSSWTRIQIESALAPTLDTYLKRNPQVSTFRRATGLTAHPTTQGVRMRNTATNATSRSLVLRDGIPQNDPFGAWIQWNRIPIYDTEQIRLYPAGHYGAWGNLSSGGVISATSIDPLESNAYLDLQIGTLRTASLAIGKSFQFREKTGLALRFSGLTTAGYVPVQEADRGPIDEEAWSRFNSTGVRVGHRLSDTTQLEAEVGLFAEERGNGTPLSGNSSDASDFSVRLHGQASGESTWQAIAFHQRRDFSNSFTSVDEDRMTERPVLDQYDIPADSTGLSMTWSTRVSDRWDLMAGADLRFATGEVNERYRNLGQGFTRDRSAGGRQQFLGAFLSARFEPSSKWIFEGTIRADHWRETDGFRIETDISSGDILSNLSYEDQSGWVPTIGISATRRWDSGWSGRLVLSHGFRSPTLNERYRPFRVGNDITESNPDLGNETTSGSEVIFAHDAGGPVKIEFGVFGYRLDGMIGNVFRTSGPSLDPICGFVPDGGSCSQRENIDRSQAWGFEGKLIALFSRRLTGSIHYVRAATEVTRSPSLRAIDGSIFPHAPEDRLLAEFRWSPIDSLNGVLRLNHSSFEYEDLANARKLPAVTTVDLAMEYRPPGSAWAISLAVDNLLDAVIENGLATNGTITVAEPRMFLVSIRYDQ